ncbi:MAG: hypothetical protein OXC10_20955 [Rhodospirillaceae bacterium]|nr:hypothetical protein [Rhodospirillaceae bacterium]
MNIRANHREIAASREIVAAALERARAATGAAPRKIASEAYSDLRDLAYSIDACSNNCARTVAELVAELRRAAHGPTAEETATVEAGLNRRLDEIAAEMDGRLAPWLATGDAIKAARKSKSLADKAGLLDSGLRDVKTINPPWGMVPPGHGALTALRRAEARAARFGAVDGLVGIFDEAVAEIEALPGRFEAADGTLDHLTAKLDRAKGEARTAAGAGDARARGWLGNVYPQAAFAIENARNLLAAGRLVEAERAIDAAAAGRQAEGNRAEQPRFTENAPERPEKAVAGWAAAA